MKNYTKIFEGTDSNFPGFITEYNVVENGIYISYADGATKFEPVEDENDLLESIKSIEESMKLQVIIVFSNLYNKDTEKLYQDLKEHKKLINKKLKTPIILLAIAIVLTVNLYYTPSFINLCFVIVSSLLGRKKAIKIKEMNEVLNAKLEFAKRFEFLKIEEDLNEAIEKEPDVILKGTKKNTKLIAKDNLEKGLPAITMNYIDEISLKDINRMLDNVLDNEEQELKNYLNDVTEEISDEEINYTEAEENNNTNKYNYQHDLTKNNNTNTYEEDLTENKVKIKTRKKD